jgi:hypothetical protein
MLKRISMFFIVIGLIAWFGPFFGLGVRGTDASQNTPEIGVSMLLIGAVFYFFSTLGGKK